MIFQSTLQCVHHFVPWLELLKILHHFYIPGKIKMKKLIMKKKVTELNFETENDSICPQQIN